MNTNAILQIPKFSQKVLSCFTTDNSVITQFALRENKSSRQKANYFYQNTVVSKHRSEQRLIMLNFINTMIRPSESIADFCIRQFNNHSSDFIKLKVTTPDELLAVLNGLYSSNVDQHLNSVFRAIATRAISNTFEEIYELNKDLEFEKYTVGLGEASLTDTVYAYAAPTLKHFIWSLCFLIATGIGCFFIAAIQGVFTPFNVPLTAQLISASTDFRWLHTSSIALSMFALFLVPVGLGFYLTDKLHPLKRIHHIQEAFDKTVGSCLLFLGCLTLSFFTMQLFVQKNSLSQMVLAKDKAAAYTYIDQHYSDYSKNAFMKAQVLTSLNRDKPLDEQSRQELRGYAKDFMPVQNIDDLNAWNEADAGLPTVAVKEIQSAVFSQNQSGLHQNKSFLQFFVVLNALAMLFTAFQACRTKQIFDNGAQ